VGWLKRGRSKDSGGDDRDPVAWVGEDGDGGEPSGRPAYGSPSGEAPAAGAGGTGEVGGTGGVGGPDDGATGAVEGFTRSHGPWDVSEVASSEAYVDLGGLWLPGRDGMELRLEVEQETDRVIAATVQLGNSAVQLQAFAAPRTAGIWDEIRKEIASSVTRQGGTADDVPGPFGRELLARVPTRTPDGRTGHQPARFAGVDGPRWFLRAVFHGEAAYETEKAADLEDLVRGVVVIRGTEAMAPRELLSLSLPDAAPTPGADEDEGGDPLKPFERGPEITEVR
jgi:hypothetical protein